MFLTKKITSISIRMFPLLQEFFGIFYFLEMHQQGTHYKKHIESVPRDKPCFDSFKKDMQQESMLSVPFHYILGPYGMSYN